VLKQRYWWQPSTKEDFSDCDFIWTGWKKQKHIDYLMQLNGHNYKGADEGQPSVPTKIYNKLE
jgi:hypothetical protein